MDIERLINVVKQQAELFMLEIGAFYPFGTAIGSTNEIIPIGAYIDDENDNPPSQPIIDLLEKGITEELRNGRYKIGVIAIDVTLRKGSEAFDAMQLRFFEYDKVYTQNIRYNIEKDKVVFFDVE